MELGNSCLWPEACRLEVIFVALGIVHAFPLATSADRFARDFGEHADILLAEEHRIQPDTIKVTHPGRRTCGSRARRRTPRTGQAASENSKKFGDVGAILIPQMTVMGAPP